MPTIDEVAQAYVQRLDQASTQRETEIILEELNRITYEGTSTLITDDDKEILLQKIYNISRPYAIKTFDNKYYLALVSQMLQQIRAGKK